VTGSELKQLRADLAEAIGRPLSAADMARLCGLTGANAANTYRKWEVRGPSGPAVEFLRVLAMASERYPILEKFDVFNGFTIDEEQRPARRAAFRASMRQEVLKRLGDPAP